MRQRGAELARVREEVRLLERVLAEEPAREQLEAGAERGGKRRGHLLDRCFAPEQEHRVRERAAARERERVERTVGFQHARDLDALLQPQAAVDAVGHVQLGGHRDAVGARRRAPRARPAAGTALGVSSGPPHASVRRFSFGERNALEQVVVAEVDLDRVEAAFDEDAGTVGELLG